MTRSFRFIASSSCSFYLGHFMVRFICAFFIALAMFASPLVMASGGTAMVHAAAGAAVSGHGHCDEGKAPAPDGQADREMSCASACAAFPAAPPAIAAEALRATAPVLAARSPLLFGLAPERETPPPRFSPTI
jgi:hypothetical protein